jgi:hypothetical protein
MRNEILLLSFGLSEPCPKQTATEKCQKQSIDTLSHTSNIIVHATLTIILLLL